MDLPGETAGAYDTPRILLIEDDEDHAELIRRAFDASGGNFNLSHVDTLRKARDFLRENTPDMVIADLVLPDGDSMVLLEDAAAESRDYPVIVMTSHGGEEVAVRAMKAGALDYVVKSDTAFMEMPRTARRAIREWRHIQERKKAERQTKRLATAIERAADAILITDSAGTIQYVNPAFTKMTGWASGEVVGKKPDIVKSGRQNAEFYRQMWACIKNGMVWTGRLFNRRKDGSVYEEEMTITPVMNESGELENFVAVKRDISRESFLVRARDYFTSITSHELRTPLFKLQMASTLLDELSAAGADPQKLAMAKLAIADSFENLSRITSATAIITDLSMNAREWSPQYFVLSNVLAACAENARITAARNGRKVAINGPPAHCKAVMSGDPSMIHRALEEILSNAVKYTPDGKSVNISCAVEGADAVVIIADEGIGISLERMAELFEPFFSLEDPLFHSTGRYKFKGGGLGLGLKIARLIVESHGGKIRVASEGENRGCSVTVTLPAVTTETK